MGGLCGCECAAVWVGVCVWNVCGEVASFIGLFGGKEGLLLTVHACAKLLENFP